jgi:hypothetical protein
MEKTATYYLLLVMCFSVGCSSDPYRSYLGLWERVDEGASDWHEVLEIKRDGETILFNDNVFAESDMLGRPKQPSVMEQRDGRLSIANGFGGVPLGLSDDKFLLLADRKYKHMTDGQFKELRAKLAEEKRVAEQNRAQCKELRAQWRKERDALPSAHRGELELVLAKRKELDERYQAKQKAVPKCSFVVRQDKPGDGGSRCRSRNHP